MSIDTFVSFLVFVFAFDQLHFSIEFVASGHVGFIHVRMNVDGHFLFDAMRFSVAVVF